MSIIQKFKTIVLYPEFFPYKHGFLCVDTEKEILIMWLDSVSWMARADRLEAVNRAGTKKSCYSGICQFCTHLTGGIIIENK